MTSNKVNTGLLWPDTAAIKALPKRSNQKQQSMGIQQTPMTRHLCGKSSTKIPARHIITCKSRRHTEWVNSHER